MRTEETPMVVPVSKYAKDKIKVTGIRKSRRVMFRRLNWGFVRGFCPICVDLNDPFSFVCGYVKRLLRDIPKPVEGFEKEFSEFVYGFCVDYLDPLNDSEIMSYREWRDTLNFPESRKLQYDYAYDLLHGGKPTRRQRCHIDSFGKLEQYDSLKMLRTINSRADVFKVFSGPLFKSIERRIYDLPYFVKHLTPTQRIFAVKALKKSGSSYLCTDFTAYESHFTPAFMLSCECLMYRYMLRDSPDCKIICDTLVGVNKIHTRIGLRAKLQGRRMSGDMCTSLGNGFSNLMLFLFLVNKKGFHYDTDVDALVEGDDGLFRVPKGLSLTTEDYEKCGFSIKIESVDDPCEASFCRLMFSSSCQTIREPRRFLNSFGWTHSFINGGSKLMDQLLRAKALSAVYETPQCPIVSVLARKALEHTRRVRPRFVVDGYHEVPPDEFRIDAFAPTLETRLLFDKLFHVPVSIQIKIEKLINEDKLDEIVDLLPADDDHVWFENRFVV
jgi:hypothetical protein